MRRNAFSPRMLLVLLLLAGLFFGAAGGAAAREEKMTQPQSPPVDLSLTMTIPSSDQFPNVNDTVTFTIKVKNNDPAYPATGVSVKDVLPAGLRYKSDDGGGTYNNVSGIWTVGSIAAGQTAQLKINAIVKQIGPITNRAEIWHVDQDDPDSFPQNCDSGAEDDCADVTINPRSADLNIAMSVDDPSPDKNQHINFTITVTNVGPNDAENVTVKDLLPSGLTYVSDDSSGSYNASTGIWSVGTLLASGVGSSATLAITAKATTSGLKTNTAEVWNADQYDPDSTPANGVPTEDDYASVSVTPNAADLSLELSMDNPAPSANDHVTFTLTVRNEGPQPATNVLVRDCLTSAALSPGNCPAVSDYLYLSDDSGGNYDGVTGIWTVGTVPVGGSRTLNLTVKANVDGVDTNWAEIWDSDQFDPDARAGNNSRNTDDDDGAPMADLSVVKSVKPLAASVDTDVIFTLTLSNKGAGNASNVVVKDVLPAGLRYISASGPGVYNSNNGLWHLGFLAAGANAVLKITAVAEQEGVKVNKAEVWAAKQTDPDSKPANGAAGEDDYASVQIAVTARTKRVVINEVAWMGTSSLTTSDEWIELYNATTGPVDLTNWHLISFRYVNGDFYKNLDIPLQGTIGGGGYYLLERRQNAVIDIDSGVDFPGCIYALSPAGDQGVKCTTTGGHFFSDILSNDGEILLLCSDTNMLLNQCHINALPRVEDSANAILSDTGSIQKWPAGSSSTYGSMERKFWRSNQRTNWFTNIGKSPFCEFRHTSKWNGSNPNADRINGTPGCENWASDENVVATPLPTSIPTRTPTPRARAGPVLVLNEVLPRPGADWNNDGKVDVYDEFIEVMNAGTVDLNLSAYKLDDYELDASGKVILNGFTLPSKTLKPGEKAVFYGSQTGILLDDSGDTVRLLRASNNSVLDAVTYSPVKSLDSSICRYADGYGLWLSGCFPTPGLPNSLTGGDIRLPSTVGSTVAACLLPDSTPPEFVQAECGENGLGVWNPAYWDSFSGEGNEIWLSEEDDKWAVIYR